MCNIVLMGKKEKSALIKHMESLGYTSKEIKFPGGKYPWFSCDHEEYGRTFVSTQYDNFIMFLSVWPISGDGAEHLKELMYFSNEINRNTTITKSTVLTKEMMDLKDDEYDKKPHQINLQAIYYGIYDEKTVTNFLDNWHNDNVRMDSNPIYNKYFRPIVEEPGLA